MSRETIPVHSALPPESHPLSIRGPHIEADEALLSTARGAMQSAYDVFGRVDALARQFASERRPRAKIADAALPHVERAAEQFGRAIDQLRARRDVLRRRVDQKLEGDARDPAAAEIRAYVRDSKQAPTKVIELARAGDRRSIAAVLNAPPFLSGLTPEQQSDLRDIAAGAMEPDDHGLLGDLDANLARLEHASETFLRESAKRIKAWRDDSDAVIAAALGGAR